MQSLAAETDFCAPEKQKQTIPVTDWKFNSGTLTPVRTQNVSAHFTSQSWYNWRTDWYSLERSAKKSMSSSIQRGSESGSKLIQMGKKKNEYKTIMTKMCLRLSTNKTITPQWSGLLTVFQTLQPLLVMAFRIFSKDSINAEGRNQTAPKHHCFAVCFLSKFWPSGRKPTEVTREVLIYAHKSLFTIA